LPTICLRAWAGTRGGCSPPSTSRLNSRQ
jgi:hypothetical protein